MSIQTTRSEIMSRIRSRDTAPELKLRRALWAAGLRYRLKTRLPGQPDIVFPGAKVAVFVDGCFWHGCPMHYSGPSTRSEFWARKLRDNVMRDARVDSELGDLMWTVVRIWQHDLGSGLDDVVRHVVTLVRGEKADPVELRGGRRASECSPTWPAASSRWWRCHCGSLDVQVISISSPGSLKPAGHRRPESAMVRCRACGEVAVRPVS